MKTKMFLFLSFIITFIYFFICVAVPYVLFNNKLNEQLLFEKSVNKNI